MYTCIHVYMYLYILYVHMQDDENTGGASHIRGTVGPIRNGARRLDTCPSTTQNLLSTDERFET